MASVRDVLEVFGALDRAIIDSGDPAVSAAADRILPGSAAVNTTRNPKRPGVRVVTRKVVYSKDISPFAQARLLCIGGYGTQSADFLLGSAENPPPNAQDAARQDDAGKWGVDGWIRLIHNLLDLHVRTYASTVNIALAGPSWWLRPTATEPGPSEAIDVTARPYPRTFAIAKPVEQIGRKDVRIPDHALAFESQVLAAGEKSFQIRLTDQRYVGASYTGTLRLQRADGTAGASDSLTITVGL